MPVTKSAEKKLRKDKKRELANKRFINLLKKSIRLAKEDPKNKNIQKAISLSDKAAKKNIIHKNKAARIKSSLVKVPLAIRGS